jgi:transposase
LCHPARHGTANRPTCASAGSRRSSGQDDQKKHHRARVRGRVGGRSPVFDAGRYEHNTVERCLSKLRQFRAVATRYDKRDYMYEATVDLASIRIWLRKPVP